MDGVMRAGVLLLLSGVIPATASGQVRLGLALGGNSARLHSPESFTGFRQSARAGFQGGVVVAIGEGRVALLSGLVFTQKGARWQDDDLTGSEFRDYLQAPLLVRVAIGDPGAGVHPFLYAGPAAAGELRCRVSVAGPGFSETSGCEPGAEPGSRPRTEVSLIGGLGIVIGAASIGVQYDLGMTNLASDPADVVTRTRTVSVVVRYLAGARP